MQVCRCAYVDSVTDPSLFPFPRHSNVCYSFTKEAYHRSSIRDFSLGQGLRISLRKKRIPRISESNHCLQSSTEASWGKIRTARPGRQADGVKDKGTSTHDRVHLDDVLDEIIYVSPQIYPTEKDAPIEFDARAPYLQTSRTHVGRQKLSVRTTISSSENERTLDPGIVASSRKKDDLAALRWLRNMGEAYGSSLILLVGSGYCIQGFRCFPWFLVNFYFKDVLTVDPGTLQVIQNTVNLPMVAKPVYGIISDAVYIGGAHRVPYLVIGGFLQAISWVAIAFLPGDGSSICIIAVLLAFSNLGASIVDVANDALVAECAKKKRTTGELQSFSWLSTSVGGVLGNLTGAFALSWIDFRVMFSMFGMLLACQASKSLSVNEGHFGLHMSDIFDSRREKREGLKTMPMKAISDVYNGPTRAAYAFAFEDTKDMWMHPKINDERLGYPSMRLGEDAGCKQDSIDLPDTAYWSTQSVRPETLTVQQPAKLDGMQKQFVDLLNLVRKPEIFFPLSWFMSSYAIIPTLAGTMFFFQTQHLKIDPSVVGMSKVMGQIGLVGASMVYTRYLKGMPLRQLLGSVQVLLCLCMMFDILLVKRMNVGFGVPDVFLVMGASAFVDAINQFKILPFMVLLAQLCPAGNEGSLLAAFMSVQCLATIISGYMGVTLTSMLHITCDDFSELPTGILLESMAALLPLFWISFIPDKASGSAAIVQYRDGKK